MFSVINEDNGTAILNADYQLHGGVVNFPPNVPVSSLTYIIKDDDEVESDESFSLTLQPTVQDGSVTLGPTKTMTVIIKDNDQPPGMAVTSNDSKLTSANNLLPMCHIPVSRSISELLTSFAIKITLAESDVEVKHIKLGIPLDIRFFLQ